MKTSLAHIDTVTAEALAHELESPFVTLENATRAADASLVVIGGLVVRDESAGKHILEEARQARRRVLTSYLSDREAIIEILRKANITPLATLPSSAWNKICSDSGLIRLNPDRRGQVSISDGILNDIRLTAESIVFCASIALMMIPVVGVCAGAYAYMGWPAWGVTVSTLLALVVSFLTIGILFLDENSIASKRAERRLGRLLIKRFAKKPMKDVLRAFFPFGSSLTSSFISAQVVLPTPPADVAAILLRAKNLKLRVAAEPGAIAFAQSVEQILAHAHTRQMRAEELEMMARANRLQDDPIVYVEHESAVAIIAQFGDFPIELGVVNRVVNSEHLV